MWINSTSNPFFLKSPSSWATQLPLMLLAKDVQQSRTFVWAAEGLAITRNAKAATMAA